MHGRPPSQGRRGMLEKIVQVNRLGRWSYTARGSACDFDRFTILYGDNGSGKTMLAAALDSLRSNEPKFVLGRRSPVSYTHLRAHETDSYLVCRLLLEKKKQN